MASRNITLTILKNANALAHDLPGNGMWHCCSKSSETGLQVLMSTCSEKMTPVTCSALTSEEDEWTHIHDL